MNKSSDKIVTLSRVQNNSLEIEKLKLEIEKLNKKIKKVLAISFIGLVLFCTLTIIYVMNINIPI